MAVAPALAKPAKVPITKRQPALIIGGIVTLIDAVLLTAPSLGIPIPDNIAKLLTLAITLAGSFGIKSQVRPAALSVPSPLAKAEDAAKAGLGSHVAPNKPSGIAGAIANTAAKLKPKGK